MDAGIANHLKAFNNFLQLGIRRQSKSFLHRCQLSRNQQNCFKETVSVPAKQKKLQNAWSLQSMSGLEIQCEFGSTSRCMSCCTRSAAAHWFGDRDIDTMSTCAVAYKRP